MSFLFPGITKVVAYKFVKKRLINKGDSCGTITIARCGLSSGADGPRFYLVKSNKIGIHTFKGNFSTKHGAPPGSKVVPTQNAYMTDKVCNEMTHAFAKVLRCMSVVNNYPNL